MDNLTTSRTPTMRVIPATGMAETLARLPEGTRIKVAAYCRVSTDNREQESSYEAQVEYFQKHIANHQGWEFAGIYADPGISGKSIKRPQFQMMMKDAREGKINRILAKSVSRFARNTLDCVACCRELKEMGIGVYFEKEGIDTMDPNSSFVLTLMASLAEEESRSISTNTKWGTRKRYKEGKVNLNAYQLWGYYFDENGEVKINEEEAKVVRKIFHDYAGGMTLSAIADEMMDLRIKTITGKDVWNFGTVKGILTNERYMGDMRLQKSFKPDFLSRARKNNGEVEGYYISNHHPAIIEPDFFRMVQYMLKKDLQMKRIPVPGTKYSLGRNVLSGKLFCGDCGSNYVRKNQDNKNGAVRTWVCSRHRLQKDCPAIPIRESVIFNAVDEALRAVLSDKKFHIQACLDYANKVYYSVYEKESFYREKLEKLDEQLDELSENTTDYESGFFLAQLEGIRNEIAAVKEERDRVIPSYHVRRLKADKAKEMIEHLNSMEILPAEKLVEAISKMVDKIIVIDNDLDTESLNVLLFNGEGLNVKLVNPKKRRCKHKICPRSE